eukprot:s586_g12.t1
MSEYGKSLGVTQEDQGNPDILWVVHQAFHSPLPGSWTEHVDEDRVYYHNSATDVSTWNHPMDDVYRDLIKLIKKLRPGPEPLSQKDQDQRCAQAVQDHLLEVHRHFVADLGSWSGPFRSEDGEEYFFNEKTQISTWVNPLEDCEIEMSIRQAVLSRCLLPSLPDGQRQLDVPDSVTLPSLHLPILPPRGERVEPERDQEAFASARSFYTARETPRSARSGASAGVSLSWTKSPCGGADASDASDADQVWLTKLLGGHSLWRKTLCFSFLRHKGVYNRMLQQGDLARGSLGYGQHRLAFQGPEGWNLRQVQLH